MESGPVGWYGMKMHMVVDGVLFAKMLHLTEARRAGFEALSRTNSVRVDTQRRLRIVAETERLLQCDLLSSSTLMPVSAAWS